MNSTETKHYSCYINGEWLDDNTREVIEVENPANNEVYATVTACTKDDVQYALETSEKAQVGWGLTPANTRAQHIIEIAKEILKFQPKKKPIDLKIN